jgi:probable F420-dependent oxidoreductase
MGADVIFGSDHFRPSHADGDTTSFEGWTTLAACGELTTRAEIGLLCSGMKYRSPDLLADMARTVDHISGGRLILGFSAGGSENGALADGYDASGGRFRALVEGLASIEYRLASLRPPPVRAIPFLIDGAGDNKTLPIIAGFADIWHTAAPIDEFRRQDDMLKSYAQAAQRDDSAIERAVWWRGPSEADLYRKEGATLFTAELKPNETGYDLSTLAELIAWRNGA